MEPTSKSTSYIIVIIAILALILIGYLLFNKPIKTIVPVEEPSPTTLGNVKVEKSLKDYVIEARQKND